MAKRRAVYNPEADKRWNKKNREHRKYLNYRSMARSFVRNLATEEDLQELEGLMVDRRKTYKFSK